MFKAIRQGAARVLSALARVFGPTYAEAKAAAVKAPDGPPKRRGEAVVIEAGPGAGAKVLIEGHDVSRYVSAVNVDLSGQQPPAVVLEIPAAVARIGCESAHLDLSQMPRPLARQLLQRLRVAFPDD